jgi:ABC-type uncharacterized transport system permease subunit
MNEITGENLTELEKRYRRAVFIVLAQVFAVLVLIFVSWLFAPKIETNLSNQDLTTIWVAVLFIAIGSFILRRMFFSWERLKNIGILKGVPRLLRTLQRNSVILAVLALVVAFLGFLLAAFSGNSWDMFRAGVIALVVSLINFPRKKIWKTIVSNLEKV